MQETRLEKNLDYRTKEGHRVITTAAKNGKNGIPSGGTAIILCKDIAPMVKNTIRHSHRMLQVMVQNDQHDLMVNLFSIYTPHNGYSIEQKKLFWKSVRNAYKHTCKKVLLLLELMLTVSLGPQTTATSIKKQLDLGQMQSVLKKETGCS